MSSILQETALSLGEGAAPVWRGVYAGRDPFFEAPEYAAAAGGRGIAGAAARAAFTPRSVTGVPLATYYGVGPAGPSFLDPETEMGVGAPELSPSLLMEHFAHSAVLAESDPEADAFILPLVPLAAKLLAPRLLPLLRRAAPRLIRGAINVMRTLRRNPRTRGLIRTLPAIVRRTMRRLGRIAQRNGQPIAPGAAARALAVQTRRILGTPQAAASTIRRARVIDRHYHIICRRIVAPTVIP